MTTNQLSKFKKPFIIVGLGKSGMSAAKLLIATGLEKSDVILFDEKQPAELNTWTQVEKFSPGTLVVSPGIPLQGPHIQKLKQLGWVITSEISLACQFLSDEKIIGITGSVAKSTVTTLVGQAARHDDPHAFVGGNLGIPFCDYAMRLLEGKTKARWIVLELSSYQLENCQDLILENSAITFLSANHLERYKSIDEYYLTKCRISSLTKNLCVLNAGSPDNVAYSRHCVGKIKLVSHQEFPEKNLLENIKLLGNHNKDNFCVAFELAQVSGFTSSAIQAMQQFPGLEHRLEFVGEWNKVTFINDSKATAMDSVIVAVQAAKEKAETGQVILLLGGKDKNLPWQDLTPLGLDQQIKVVFFGACGLLAKEKMKMPTAIYKEKLEAAIEQAVAMAQPSDVILLSPGGTSLDEFKNFEDRGHFFKQKIKKIIQQSG